MIRSRAQIQGEAGLNQLINAKIGDLFNLFVSNSEDKNLTPKTIKDYKQKIGTFIKFCNNNGLEFVNKIHREHISLFLHQLRETNSDVSVADYFNCLRSFFNYLVSDRYIQKSPMFGMTRPKFTKKVIQPLSNENINTMLNSLDRRTFLGARNTAILLVFLDTAMRLDEMYKIKLIDLDKNIETIKVLGKGAKERVLHLGIKTRSALMRWLIYRKSRAKDDIYLWLSEEGNRLGYWGLEDVIQDLGKLCGIKGVRVSPHTVRHTSAITMLREGANSFEVQVILGHTTQEMTGRYLASLTSEQVVERHKKFSPADHLPR